MNRRFFVLFSVVFALLFSVMPFRFANAEESQYSGTVYYVDSVYGNDKNNGKSRQSAFSSLNRVNRVKLKPGDAVLFRRGCVWNKGCLIVSGSGTKDAPVTISSYGEDSDQKPVIFGNYSTCAQSIVENTAVYINNKSYVVIDGLNIINANNSKTESMYGIKISTYDGYFTEGCVIKNCVISGSSKYDWSTENQKKLTGIECSSPSYWGFISSLEIENNEIYNCKGNGIIINGARGGCNEKGEPNTENAAKNVHIKGNYLQNIGGDGILVNNCLRPLVEYNTCNKSHSYDMTGYHVAMWPFASYGATFQFNESYNTQTNKDGQGFDCDYQSYYTLFQYNYSHDNQGGFMLICTEPINWDKGVAYNVGATVRYNISQNDAGNTFCLTCHITDTKIYNNTIYTAKNVSQIVNVYSRDNVKYPINTLFANNIIYANGGGISYFSECENTVWKNNIYYGVRGNMLPIETNEDIGVVAEDNILADPMCANPGGAGYGIDNCDAYKLKEGSPAIGKGAKIEDNGGRDYYGNAVGDSVNIGAYNGEPISSEVTTHENRADVLHSDPTLPTTTTQATTTAPQPQIIIGDVNGSGKTDSVDVLILNQYLADIKVEIIERNSDLTHDGVIDTSDVLALNQLLAGIKIE